MSYPNQKRHGGDPRKERQPIYEGINFSDVSENLFSEIPERIAKKLGSNGSSNKPSQLRNFYNEIVMWEEKSQTKTDDEFRKEILPFLKMLKAKAAYAHGRNNKNNDPNKGLVDKNFLELLTYCLNQVQDKQTMSHFKLFMESFMGFYKLVRPKD
ncbi:MAG: hypothetical protein AXA67_08285 [Methylothermaceae bacteria B42]|nr:MAG: hypothetical protein AXA67_08285 [Methylothermaceae bacteria B42]HHJ38550.1 type III-A CRISPR-associated protein Csm2 [Methylothermaceae bacterium]